MITVMLYKIKYQTQEDYDNYIKNLILPDLKCNCGICGGLSKHSFYQRIFGTHESKTKIKIRRLICKFCKKTHAVIPLEIIHNPQMQLRQASLVSNMEQTKYLTQESYDNIIENINIQQLECTCGKSGNLTKHGYYQRYVKTPEGKVKIKILRIICQVCKKTHAIFTSEIVPYSQTQLCDHLKIIEAYEKKSSFEPIMEQTQSIDESNIGYIIKKYVYDWRERLNSINLSVTDDIIKLVTQCLKEFGKQFMQIKSTSNAIFLKPT